MENNIFELQYAIDTFYFLICGALVMWMAAGFAMLESGLYSEETITVKGIETTAFEMMYEVLLALPESKHTDRSVRWIVTEGSATIQIGATTRRLPAGSSASAPPGIEYRLENVSTSDVLKLIEVSVDTGVEGDNGRD